MGLVRDQIVFRGPSISPLEPNDQGGKAGSKLVDIWSVTCHDTLKKPKTPLSHLVSAM